MKKMICEMCGSSDLLKVDGLFACQTCGAKYSPEEAKKMMVEGAVTIDKSSEIDNLIKLMDRAIDNKIWKDVANYSIEILKIDADNYKAIFYKELSEVYSAKVGDFATEITDLKYATETAIKLAPKDNIAHIASFFATEITLVCVTWSNYFKKEIVSGGCGRDVLLSHINRISLIIELQWYCSGLFSPDNTVLKKDFFINIVNDCAFLCRKHKYRGYDSATGRNIDHYMEIDEYCDRRNIVGYYDKAMNEISKIESVHDLPPMEGSIPEIRRKKGCYIATSVYGSYNCPEVWTLRRFRDYELNKNLFGKMFIRLYYAASPTVVKLFGKNKLFNKLFKVILDKFVNKLINKGFINEPYND